MNRILRTAAAAATLMLAANAAPGAIDRVLDALAASGRPAGQRAAAAVLAAEGARPIDGAPDLAVQWAAAGRPAREFWRTRALGPGYRAVRLGGGQAIRLEQVFLAGQRAQVAVAAPAAMAFALSVSDDDDRRACAVSNRRAKCDWTPYYTTRFKIDLKNASRQAGTFYLVLQ